MGVQMTMFQRKRVKEVAQRVNAKADATADRWVDKVATAIKRSPASWAILGGVALGILLVMAVAIFTR